MHGLSWRFLVPAALVATAWGGLHVLTSHTVAVTPAVWPVTQPSASASPFTGILSAPTPAPSAPSAGDGSIPVLPDALRHLNRSTRDTATGLYAVIRQLEEALRSHFDQLVKQLEPGR
jgi:hypothetical protein